MDAWIFDGGGGWPRNLASPQRPLRNNGAVTHAASTVGRVVNFPGGSGDFYHAPEPNDSPYLGAISIVWRGMVRVAGTRHFAGKHLGNGATSNPFDFRTEQDTLILVRANTSFRDWAGPAVDIGTFNTYGVTTPDGNIDSVPTFYKGGLPTTGSAGPHGGAGTGPATGSGADIRTGVRADAGVIMDGQCEELLIWSRALTAHEMQWLHFEPYAFLRPVVRRQRSIPEAPPVVFLIPDSAFRRGRSRSVVWWIPPAILV